MKEEKKYFLDDSNNVNRLWRLFVICCVVVAALDVLSLTGLGWHRHVSLFVEGLPGFYPLWGFIAIALLIMLARQLRRIVMRPENYYGDDD
jgi:hypothetical protein